MDCKKSLLASNTAVLSVEAATTSVPNKKTAKLNVRQTLQLTLKNNKKKITTVSGKDLVTAKSPRW